MRVRKGRGSQPVDDDVRAATPAERVGMVWPITVDAWAFMGQDVAEFRLPRHIVRVHSRKG
jgi:hypothetical protein